MSVSAEDKMALDRMLFFSDAVFAIAITLLVLDLKLPAVGLEGTEPEFQQALLQLLPSLIGFLWSFILIGQTWIEHHRMGRHLAATDRGLLWWDLALLMFVVLMPFTTSLVSEHFASGTAVALYAAAFGLLGACKVGLWRHAHKRGLIHGHGHEVKEIGRRVWATPIVSSAVTLLAIVGVPYAYVLFITIPMVAQFLATRAP